MRTLVLVAALAFGVMAHAGLDVWPFDDPARERLYNGLVHELRCMVCQNQSLATSGADLAHDLRREVYELVRQGASRQDVIDYMVQRYGDFVLYRPPVKTTTWLLWGGPAVLLGVGLVVVVMVARRRRARSGLADAERDQMRQLLED